MWAGAAHLHQLYTGSTFGQVLKAGWVSVAHFFLQAESVEISFTAAWLHRVPNSGSRKGLLGVDC